MFGILVLPFDSKLQEYPLFVIANPPLIDVEPLIVWFPIKFAGPIFVKVPDDDTVNEPVISIVFVVAHLEPVSANKESPLNPEVPDEPVSPSLAAKSLITFLIHSFHNR